MNHSLFAVNKQLPDTIYKLLNVFLPLTMLQSKKTMLIFKSYDILTLYNVM